MSKTMYVADFRYHKPLLAKVTVGKETPKTFTVTESETLLGWFYFGKRTNKDGLFLADALADALAWLLKKAQEDATLLHEAARQADEQVSALEDTLKAAQEAGK